MSADEGPDLPRRPRVAIREMEIDDLAAVYHLGELLFTSAAFPVLYRTWDPFEVTYYFNSEPENCLVAETADGRIAGFALGYTVEKDGSAWKYGYLAWLGVSPEHQGRSVAERLLRGFERRMREEGVRIILVDTEGDNHRAISFFRRNGFCEPTAHVWLTKNLMQKPGRVVRPVKAIARRRAARIPGREAVKPSAVSGVNGHREEALEKDEALTAV